MKNKQINKILFMFVIGMSLLFSVSSAEIGITPISSIVGISGNNNFGGLTYGDYIGSQIHNICNNYYLNPDNPDYRTVYSNMVQNISDNGFDYVLINVNYISAGSYWYFSIYEKDTLDIGFYLDDSKLYELCLIDSAYTKSSPIYIYHGRKTNYAHYAKNYDVGQLMSLELPTVSSFSVIDSSVDVKQIKYSGGYYWDGQSYFYESEEEPEGPTLPTNAEITSVIQNFYNSDIYKNNENFSDFFVVYYAHNQTFAFIGHTIGSDLGQVIVPPGVREQGKIYNEQWWHFFVNENAGAPPYGTTFYLYTTTDFGETFVDDGTGIINGLVNIDFSKNAVIVYSSTDYLVRTYVLDETSGEITYTDGILEGNEYTYDENLDPTENYYNPLDKFPTVNSSVADTPWNSFVAFVQSIPDKIFSAFSNLTGLTKIITIISPVGSAILIILNVLLSSVSLLSRAVMFVYTLPTIEASDALFLADVNATTGLVFTGNSWGTRFLEGLNMVKEFSWNGLNLWTLFTSFIVAIFAIHCVKLVRKHYHY